MNSDKQLELAELLRQAMDCVVLVGNPLMGNLPALDLETYRSALIEIQQNYRPDLADIPGHYIPDVQNSILKNSLVSFIERELEEYVDEGQIWVPGAKVSVERLLAKLLDIAMVAGIEHAAEAFLKSAEENQCPVQDFALIRGITIKDAIEVYDGIRLIQLPSSKNDLPHFLPLSASGIPQSHFVSATLLTMDCMYSSRFYNPSTIPRFSHAIRSADAPRFDANMFCRALSLVCDAPVYQSVKWTHLADDEIASVPGNTSISFAYDAPLLFELPQLTISNDQVEESKRLYEALMDFNAREREKLQIAINRWIYSHRRSIYDVASRIIDIGIALECLYLRDTGPELRYRLSLLGAWYLGEDRKERETISKQLKDAYNLRSRAVHEGILPQKHKADSTGLIKTARDLCRRTIIKIIREGRFPDWEKLVLG